MARKPAKNGVVTSHIEKPTLDALIERVEALCKQVEELMVVVMELISQLGKQVMDTYIPAQDSTTTQATTWGNPSEVREPIEPAASSNPSEPSEPIRTGEPVNTSEPEPSQEPEGKQAVPTIEEARRLMLVYIQKHGREKAVNVLAFFKARTVADIPSEKLADFINAVS